MKKRLSKIISIVVLTGMCSPVFAGASGQYSSDAVKHSGKAIANSAAAGFKFVSGAVAVPFLISGEIGKASGEIGDALWKEANTPLPITEDIITAGPSPAEAMREQENRR